MDLSQKPFCLLFTITQDLDQDRECGLARAQHMVQCLSQAILAEHKDKVNGHQGTVPLIQRQVESSCWKLDDLGVAEQVYLCTGSHPKDSSVIGYVNPKARNLSLDDVLTPSRLPHIVSDESLLVLSPHQLQLLMIFQTVYLPPPCPSCRQVKSEDVVGVVGSSHSAILCLRNLLESKLAPRVVNLYRSPLLYAVHLPDGRIMHDNTGLKGIAAEWARERLEAGVFEQAGRRERICIKDSPETASEALDRCTAVVHAVGFSRNPLPVIIREDGSPLTKVVHDTKSGQIAGAEGIKGFGIAFPETVVDPSGLNSLNIGLWDFMRHIREQLTTSMN